MQKPKRIFVSEMNYRDIEDQYNLKLNHLFLMKNKVDLENHILKKEISKIQEHQITANPQIMLPLLPQQKIELENQQLAQQKQSLTYDLKGRDPKGLLLEKDIHIDEQDKRITKLTHKLQEVQKLNLELEQDLAISKKKFKDLLQSKSVTQPRVSDEAFREMELECKQLKAQTKEKDQFISKLSFDLEDQRVMLKEVDRLRFSITELELEVS
ncbi:UNKNOWN [Stylonychia lemnae]|uniref:Uncharacterized protein n=1 Tax=Stylonychia lemnae TaxID=5949 RepID=A0A078AD48_STYLE|nr:UNKNOWN [Stylonychia lemnae]|eukprot:CDW80165.1 UNKNOWN [Stylonychia lemnae]